MDRSRGLPRTEAQQALPDPRDEPGRLFRVKALLVEDDPTLADVLCRVLREEHHSVVHVGDLATARTACRDDLFDVIVVDWMLPDGDGVTLSTELRQRGDATPILMLTARAEVKDRVEGLRAGADDYLTKPFEVDELIARIQALVRRSAWTAELVSGDLVFDQLRRTCRLRDTVLDLTAREYQLLARLAIARGAEVTRADLFADVWHLDFDPGSGVLDVHVSRLREKLGADSWRIETVRGVGYRLRSER